MSNWKRSTYRFSDLLRTIGLELPEWIAESDEGPWEYDIIRTSGHDSTLIFTHELMARAADPLLGRYSYFKPNPPKDGQVGRYVVGPVRHSEVHGQVDFPCGRYPGMRERLRIPVRALQVDDDGKRMPVVEPVDRLAGIEIAEWGHSFYSLGGDSFISTITLLPSYSR